ncbi:hypothetical protein [Ekhidna sp.]
MAKNLTNFVILSFLIILISCSYTERDSWELVLKTRKDGSIISGSKKILIEKLRSGSDLKLGWGWKNNGKSLEHFANPTWVGILNEKEVYAYLDPQVLSGIDWNNLNASYADSTLVGKEWRVVINTDGSFDAVWIDRNSNQTHKRVLQNHVMTWWVKSGGKEMNQLFSIDQQ